MSMQNILTVRWLKSIDEVAREQWDRLAQPLKAPPPSDVTLSGRVTSVSPLQEANALVPIVVRPVGNVMPVSP